jgi:hypothetical protein
MPYYVVISEISNKYCDLKNILKCINSSVILIGPLFILIQYIGF